MKTILTFGAVSLVCIIFTGCGMNAMDYFVKGNEELAVYNCQSSGDYLKASEMELEDEGDWYPIYMLSLGLSRYYCNDLEGALKAFSVIDQYAVLRSDRTAAEKGFEFLKSKGNRTYEITEREETLLHYYIGMINFKMGKYEDAMVEFKKVDYIADGNYSTLPLVALMRGLTYEKLNDQTNAFVAYKKISEQNPNSPVGYILAHRVETVEGNRLYWENELIKRFGLNVSDFDGGKKEIITIVECANSIPSDYKFNIKYDMNVSQAYFLDAVNPDFNFGEFAAGVLKEVGSGVARSLIKNTAANIIPGGGLIAGLFLGGEKAEQRYWMNLPQVFITDVTYLSEGQYNVTIEYYEDEELEKVKEFKANTKDGIIFITNF